MQKLIGLCGDIGAGKSSVGRMLTMHGYKVVPLAEPLKTMLKSVGLSEDDVNGVGKEQPHPLLCGKTPRKAMQLLGTEWGRQLIGPDVWLNLWDVRRGASKYVVCDDVRFQNEFDFLKSKGAHMVRVVRPVIVAGDRNHASEQEHHNFNCDATILNDGTYNELYGQINKLVKASQFVS